MDKTITLDVGEVRALLAHHKAEAKFAVERVDRARLENHIQRIEQLSVLLPHSTDF